MKQVVESKTHIKRWLIPALVISVVVAVAIGSFAGRKISIDCSRSDNVCVINVRGFAYNIEHHEVPIDKIVEVIIYVQEHEVETSRSGSSVRQSWGWIDHYIHIEWKPATAHFLNETADLKVYDIFSYSKPAYEARDKLLEFLNDPTQDSVAISFGTYRTGYCFLAFFVLALFYLCLLNAFWRVRMRASVDQIPSRLVIDSGDDTLIDRLNIDIEVFKGLRWQSRNLKNKAPVQIITRYLYRGTRFYVDEELWLVHPWGVTEKKGEPFPKRMPKGFKQAMWQFLAENAQNMLRV